MTRLANVTIGMVLVLQTCSLAASKRAPAPDNLAKYIARVSVMDTAAVAHTPGSCWSDTGRLASLSSDYKAAKLGDLVTILVVQDVTATNSGSVSSDRSFKAASGVDSLPGKINPGGAASLLGLHSAETLSGKAQASSASTLRTTLAGTVVAVLPSGNLVVEAERAINVNQERQNILLRGVVRPGDIGPANTITTTAISNLELEIKGRGLISDGTRAPHPMLRMILRILNF